MTSPDLYPIAITRIAPQLNEAALRVYLCLLTCADGMDQPIHGLRGSALQAGTVLCRRAVWRGTHELVLLGLLRVERVDDVRGGRLPNRYTLLADDFWRLASNERRRAS